MRAGVLVMNLASGRRLLKHTAEKSETATRTSPLVMSRSQYFGRQVTVDEMLKEFLEGFRRGRTPHISETGVKGASISIFGWISKTKRPSKTLWQNTRFVSQKNRARPRYS